MGTEAILPRPPDPPTRKRSIMANGSVKNGFLPWILGILGALVVAGVVASVGTAVTIGRMDENLGLFRAESAREFNRQEADIHELERKLDAHILQTRGTNDGGGGP